jgi:RNA polymerase sigma-70 factor (ECF subfamily)
MAESTSSTALPKSADIVLDGAFRASWYGFIATSTRATCPPMRMATDPLSVMMERYAGGEDEVFEPLYRLLAPRLYRFCLRLTARRCEADDCFQETLLKLHRARATYLPGASALHWAFAIARSVYLSRLRYWRRRPEILGEADDALAGADSHAHGETPEAQLEALHLHAALAAELEQMSEKNRAAYVLMKEEALTAKEAAAILGTSADAVKQRAHRAYERLRAALKGAGWGEQDGDAV